MCVRALEIIISYCINKGKGENISQTTTVCLEILSHSITIEKPCLRVCIG